MAVFSDRQIRSGIAKNQIIVHPYEPENVRGSSIDVTLGENYYRCGFQSMRDHKGRMLNPFSEHSVKDYYGEPQKAVSMEHDDWLFGIGNHPVIVLQPRERILAHTHEFIGIRGMSGTSEMRARSSWGRLGVSVCLCAGWGDPGFINRWVMEIQNFNDVAIPLPVGERVGQVIFHQTGLVEKSYGIDGKYQLGDNVKAIVEGWQPSQMLPRNYKDERKEPMAI
jgi:dCTP deaminase